MLGPFFFGTTVTDLAYLTVLEDIKHSINILFSDKDCYFRHDSTPQHYRTDVRNFLGVHFSGRWMGHKGITQYPPRSPDLTHLYSSCGIL